MDKAKESLKGLQPCLDYFVIFLNEKRNMA